MFGFFSTSNARDRVLKQQAHSLYHVCFKQSRRSVFYEELRVPDTLEGRFDLLLLHVCALTHCLVQTENADGPELAQYLFDTLFADMDQSLREAGVGDMGVPKRIKKMMLAYNGRLHAYDSAFKGEGELKPVLLRNVYGVTTETDSQLSPSHAETALAAERLAGYTRAQLEYIRKALDENDADLDDLSFSAPEEFIA